MKKLGFLIYIAGLLATAQAGSSPHPHGEPLSLMWFNQNGSISVNYSKIDDIFLNPDVAGREIVTVSIIGAFRKGKSFMMDYFLRYMYANYKSVNYMKNPLSNKQDWFKLDDAPLTGFSWKAGAHRNTAGVVIWSDVFLHDEYDGTKFAILLMDTQGLFDSDTSPADNSRIFALGTLISSIQIFNLNGVIQENQLEYLQMATEYAKFAASDTIKGQRPFQKLIFLMRDWVNEEEYYFGTSGGRKYLDSVLEVKPDQSLVLADVRKYIKSSFDGYSCFLMPHPGLKVVEDPSYDGRYSRLSKDFQKQIVHFVENTVKSSSLEVKKIEGTKVKGKDFSKYVKSYFSIFQSNDTPPIVSIYEATIESQLTVLSDKAMEGFKRSLNSFKNYSDPNLLNIIDDVIETSKKAAVAYFGKEKKMGSNKHHQNFKEALVVGLDLYSQSWKSNVVNTFNQINDLKEKIEKEIEDAQKENEENYRRTKKKQEEERKKIEDDNMRKMKEIEENIAISEQQRKADIRLIEEENRRNVETANKKLQELEEQQELERKRIQLDMGTKNAALEEELVQLRHSEKSRQFELELRMKTYQQIRHDTIHNAATQRAQELNNQMDESRRRMKYIMDELNRNDLITTMETQKLKEDLEREFKILNSDIQDKESKIRTLTQANIDMENEARRQSQLEFQASMRRLKERRNG